MPDFIFRVQALGGKFLADDIGGAQVAIYDAETGVLLDSGVTRGNSGTLVGPPPSPPPAAPSASQIVRASKTLITLADGSAAWWLVADPYSSAFKSSIEVGAGRRVKVKVRGPVGGLASAGEAEQTLWLLPEGVPELPGCVVELPGLLVQPISPLLHSQVVPGEAVNFAAKVTMMCGCQISSGTSYWPDGDFVVQAAVQQVVGGKLVTQPGSPFAMAPLTAQGQPASSFSTAVANPPKPFVVPASGTGTVYYQATISAWQKGTGNAGSAIVNFYCTYPSS